MKKKYMMNIRAIENMNPEMASFLYEEAKIFSFNGNNIPCIDLSTGRIYSSVTLDKSAPDAQITRMRIEESISNSTPIRGSVRSFMESEIKDFYGANVEGHYFMDCGSIDLPTLKSMWRSYMAKEESKKKEADKARKAEQLLNEANTLLGKVDSLIEEAKELMKN